MSDTITMSKSDLASMIAAEVAKAVAAQPRLVPADMKFVITSNIPSKFGGTWATIEVTPNGGTTETFIVDRFHDAPTRSDGAAQEIIYASRPRTKAAPAPEAKPAVKATRKAVKKA